MKRLLVECHDLASNGIVIHHLLVGACLGCGGSIGTGRFLPVGVEHPVRCDEEGCRKETAVTRFEGCRAGVRLPYGCRAWFDVESSNLDAVGVLGIDLLVRFKKGAVYRYPGSATLLNPLLRAESAGKFFAANIRSHSNVLVCAVYGCSNPSAGRGQLLCETHLASK